MYEVECPYCEKNVEIDTDYERIFEEDVLNDMECPECEKNFVFCTNITFSFNARKADCLNDGEHKYEKTYTIPEEFSRMECSMCNHIREMTEEERVRFNIGTRESYFESLKSK
jgi:endogenous inhibitor of DNA gyrase (YacG/DUF329 family)